MKNCIKILSVILLLMFFSVTECSFAKTEEVGFVKSSWRKLLGVFRQEEPKKDVKPESRPAEKTEPKAEPKPAAKKHPLQEMTKEEIIERIKHMLEISPQALDFIPELKVDIDTEGNVTAIRYKAEGIFKDVGELDKKTLIKIHNRINNERVRIQTERIQRQLEAARAGQNIPKPSPQVYVPPKPPQQPPGTQKQPPAPPKIPAPPPRPPRTTER